MRENRVFVKQDWKRFIVLEHSREWCSGSWAEVIFPGYVTHFRCPFPSIQLSVLRRPRTAEEAVFSSLPLPPTDRYFRWFKSHQYSSRLAISPLVKGKQIKMEFRGSLANVPSISLLLIGVIDRFVDRLRATYFVEGGEKKNICGTSSRLELINIFKGTREFRCDRCNRKVIENFRLR